MAPVVRFGNFEVDVAAGQLRKRGIKINLRDQSFQILASLLENAGEVVSREELRRRLWHGDVFVDFENNLNAAVARLREALCDSAERPRYIETLPRRGYRFIGNVEAAAHTPSSLRPRLVVLPFVNLNGRPEQEYFSDAVTDEIITALASMAPNKVAVIARTTAMRYKGSHKDVARIGRELAADYVVEGALRHSEEHVGVNVQLIQTSDESHVFARKYDAPALDIFQLQDSIARDIVAHIHAQGAAIFGNGGAAQQRREPTRNMSAYNEYIKGRYLMERLTFDAMSRAKQHFEDAISRDPGFALAHTALADLYSWLGYLGYLRPKDAYSIGIAYALRATESDPTLPEAHTVLAEYHKQLHYDWAAAEKEMAKGLELSSTSPFVRLRNAIVILMPQNRMAQALGEVQYALESDPLAAATRFWLGILLLLDREYDRAIEEAERLLELEPSSPWPHYILGVAYRQKYADTLTQKTSAGATGTRHWADRAVSGHLRALELAPRSDVLLGWLGLAYGVCGRAAEARAILDRLHASDRYILPTSFGLVHLGLGEIDAAFDWFERAVEERDQLMMPILSYAHFDPIRDDPRFYALLRKMNLAATPRELMVSNSN